MPKLKEQLKKSIFEKVKLEQKLKSYEENQNEKTEIIASQAKKVRDLESKLNQAEKNLKE